jgi:ATP-dependent Clp protease ATP-binding subunit ClpA
MGRVGSKICVVVGRRSGISWTNSVSCCVKDEDLRHAIAEAERDGDLEEAARLQYDQLHRVQQRREELEACQAEAQAAGTALLREQVEAGDIADLVARWTGIPVQRLLAGERRKLLALESHLGERVIGQAEAVTAVAAAIRRARAGMKDSRRPVGSFLFLARQVWEKRSWPKLWRHPCLMKKRHWYAST